MSAAEKRTRFLIQNIAVDRLPLHQVDAVPPLVMLGLEIVQLSPQLRDLQFIFVLGLETALPVDCVPHEIRGDRAGDAVESEGVKNRAHAPADDHVRSIADQG